MAFIFFDLKNNYMRKALGLKLQFSIFLLVIVSLGLACSGPDSGMQGGNAGKDKGLEGKKKELPKDDGATADGGSTADGGGTADGGDTADGGGDDSGPPNLNLGCTEADANAANFLNRRIRRLSSLQINNVLKDALGDTSFAGDLGADQETYYQLKSNANLMIDNFNITNLSVLAAQVAAVIEARFGQPFFENLFNCTETNKFGNVTCVENFISSFGKLLYRRNLTTAEVNKYKAFYTANKYGNSNANAVLSFKAMIETMINSPAFIYQTEFGDLSATTGTTTLSSIELASIISLAIKDKGPDSALLTIAESDELKNPTVLAQQVARLLNEKNGQVPSIGAKYFANFVFDWLNLDTPELEEKPGYDDLDTYSKASLAANMLNEINRLAYDIIDVKNANFDHLFNFKESQIDKSLAKIYGVPAANMTNGDFVTKSLPTDKRHGILTSAAFLANYSMPIGTTHILRGQTINEVVLCHEQIEFADDPMAGDLTNPPTPDDDPTKTERENFQVHSLNPCAGCHIKLDPPGWALGNFNEYGKFVSNKPADKPIDATGEMLLTHGRKFAFTGPVDFAQKISATEDLPLCFTDRIVRNIYGVETYSGSRCEVKTQTKKFVDTNRNIENLIGNIMSSDYFLKRKIE
ncbi:MAG: DUF1592 domain-containing protein [Oligoflexales bacterium]|nr:DUF1592 domain-containing protein [Oligoflexales bacterium]